jgi:hypothetical protein
MIISLFSNVWISLSTEQLLNENSGSIKANYFLAGWATVSSEWKPGPSKVNNIFIRWIRIDLRNPCAMETLDNKLYEESISSSFSSPALLNS